MAVISLLAFGVTAIAVAEDKCAGLAALSLANVRLEGSDTVAVQEGLPGYCRVRGVIDRAVRFELRVPVNHWNGKFYMAGCGGFCGSVDADSPGVFNSINHGLRRGYAAATTDAGHTGTSVTDGRWALDDIKAEIDWGWRAVTETARVSRDLIAAYYGSRASRSYFSGCSTGGRMGLMEAQRFPHDFDGIIAGAPALDYTGLVATRAAWNVQANLAPDGREILDRAKVATLGAAVMQACDALDGTQDGLIADPDRCAWQPRELQCTGGPRADCLTAREVAVLDHWYMPVTDGSGRVQYPGGIPRGSEPFWPLWLSGLPGSNHPAVSTRFAADFLRYMAFVSDRGAAFEVRDFDFDRDPLRLASMSRIYDATNPDLSVFQQRGGKLLVYHGWSDPIVTPQRTIDYFGEVRERMGGQHRTDSFARLFLLPGVDHCALQPGPGAKSVEFDPLPALEEWVEHGRAPDELTVRWQMQDGSVRTQVVTPQ